MVALGHHFCSKWATLFRHRQWRTDRQHSARMQEVFLANWGVYGTLLNPNQAFPGCSSPGNIAAGDAHQCLTTSMFVPSGAETTFGSGRNLFRGPGYFDMDAGLMKNFAITERFKFSIGANFFNLLNHPHFATPENNLAEASRQFGQIYATAPTPTSIYGAFQTAGVTGRLVQIVGKITF